MILSVYKKDWVINHPLDGKWNLPNIRYQDIHTTRVEIVPLGSKALWTHERIEKHIAMLSTELAKRPIRVGEGEPQSIDFSYYLKQWAEQYGFTLRQVKAQFDQWAAETKDSPDSRTLGLREFYQKNFIKASEHFDKAALQEEEKRENFKVQLHLTDLAIFSNWLNSGNARYAAYDFREALERFRRAERVISIKNFPWMWADIQGLKGNAESQLGIRVSGEEGNLLLSSSIESYRHSLKIFTRKDFPQNWAGTQNNIGNAVRDLGCRTSGKIGTALLQQAETTFQKALEIYTFEYLPTFWAQTKNNLAKLYETQEKWTAALQCYSEVVKVYPDQAVNKTCILCQEKLFLFNEAYQLSQRLADKYTVYKTVNLRFVECCFTTARFNEGNQHIQKIRSLFSSPQDSHLRIILETFTTANHLALGNPVDIKPLIKLEQKHPPDFKPDWTFTGTNHFIRTHKFPAPQRKTLLALFTAMEKKDRDSILKALKQTPN